MTKHEIDPKPLSDSNEKDDGNTSQTKVVIALEVVFLIIIVYFSFR